MVGVFEGAIAIDPVGSAVSLDRHLRSPTARLARISGGAVDPLGKGTNPRGLGLESFSVKPGGDGVGRSVGLMRDTDRDPRPYRGTSVDYGAKTGAETGADRGILPGRF